MDSCLLRLKRDGSAEWRAGGRRGHGPLEKVPAFPGNQALVVMVPGEDVLLADAVVPSRRAGDIERALPYALEEWLVGAPEDQHFAWMRDVDGLHAAVVSHERMRHWTGGLKDAGLQADVLMPDVLGLPWTPGEWSLCLWQGRALLRHGEASGVACASEIIDTVLASLYEGLHEEQRPARMRVWCADDAFPFDAPVPVQAEAVPNALIDLLSADAAPLNLLRGPYASGRGWRRGGGKAWRWAAGMAAVWLLSLFALQSVHYFVLAHQRKQLQARIEHIFHQALPDEHRIVDARVQMQQALDRLRNGGHSGNDVLDLLADASGPLAHAADMQVQRIDYRNGQLDVSLSAGSASAFGGLTAALKSNGLDASVRNLDASGSTATGHVEIGRPGS